MLFMLSHSAVSMVKYRATPRKVLYCDHLRPRTNQVRTDKVNGAQTLTDRNVQVFGDVISVRKHNRDGHKIHLH